MSKTEVYMPLVYLELLLRALALS